MTKKNNKDKLQERVRIKLMRRLTEEGYSDVTDFWRNTGIQVSHETVRRALHGGRATSVESIIKIGVHLGLSNAELAEIVGELGDTFWPRLLWNPKAAKADKAILAVTNRLGAADPSYWDCFRTCWKILGKAAGINIDEYLDELPTGEEARNNLNDIQNS